jgi:hypothetical protein
MVRARHLTPESLIRALEQGDFYASSGVVLKEIAYSPGEATLRLEIEPEGDAHFSTEFIATLAEPREPRSSSETVRPAETASPAPQADQPPPIGQVLSTVSGLQPVYQLTGKELYVRAVVTSSVSHADPSFEGQRKQAWTQPVGWEKWLPH